jgi:hypothetical protein
MEKMMTKMMTKESEKAFCPDCNKIQFVEQDPCPIHDNCGDFAWCCSECGSLNVDAEMRQRK